MMLANATLCHASPYVSAMLDDLTLNIMCKEFLEIPSWVYREFDSSLLGDLHLVVLTFVALYHREAPIEY
jgi:hypothetical protein